MGAGPDDESGATPCPCGLGEPYATCCGRYHRGAAAAPTAERLMRSRYSAFAVGDEAYLLATWHPGTRPARLALTSAPRWLRLDVLATTGGGLLDAEGSVEFCAHYVQQGRSGSQHETSSFTRHEGRWTYVGPQAAG